MNNGGNREIKAKQKVISSSLRSVGYDGTSLTLEIEFHNGSIYHYFQVPPAVHLALLFAQSKGHFFDTRVKYNYAWEKVL